MYGGPVRAMHEITRRLARRGHHVEVFATDVYGGVPFPHPVGRPVEIDGVTTTFFRHVGGDYAPYVCPPLARALRRRVREFEVVHASCGFSWTGVQVRRQAVGAGVPFVYQAHGALDRVKWRRPWLVKPLAFMVFERRVIRDAAALIALNAFEAGAYRACGAAADRIAVIPNGVDTDFWRPGDATQAGAFRQRHAIACPRPIIACVGRLEKIKGVDRLLEAFARVARPSADRPLSPSAPVLVFAGPDEGMLPWLQARARTLGLAEAVLFADELPSEQVRDLYRDAAAVALFSYGEGLPLTALEALACGAPVVVSEECHVPEVEEAGAGHVVRSGDIDAFAGALNRLLADPALRARQSARARALAVDRFPWDSVIGRIEALYESVMGWRPGVLRLKRGRDPG